VPSPRHLRSDAARNRERILAAAEEVFAEEGAGAGIAEVARRAGVGHATVFRRFATKEALLLALMAARMEALTAAADEEAATAPRSEALERFMARMAEHLAGDRGFRDASGCSYALDPDLDAPRRALADSVRRLLVVAQEAGRVRCDLRTEDVFFLCSAVTHRFNEEHVEPGLWRRYLTLAIDGMRTPVPSLLDTPAPSLSDLEARRAAERSATPRAGAG
jgi:AcrR family transcriptional regulator